MVIERHGRILLTLVGVGLVVAGLMADESAARIGIAGLGAALIVLAVLMSEVEGPLKIGPGGIETELRRTAGEESKSVGEALAEGGLDLMDVAGGERSLDDLADAKRVRRELKSLVATLERLERADSFEEDRDLTAAFLRAAHGLMADGAWRDAARFFDRYTAIEPDNWDAQFSRAVAHANSRDGRDSDIAALRAYNDAIVLRPAHTSPNLIARLLSYRAAMLKRLGRLDEAEADLRVAERKADEKHEEDDVRYNLACVLAMKGRREEALEYARRLRGTPYVGSLRAHRERYFNSIANEPDFLDLIA
jgi:tetratricopeptide (TPR) repeat protein